MSEWLKKRRNRSNKRKAGGPVGTEAVALEQMQHNKLNFRYPEEGFATPIEYTLLYSMIKEGPKTYPAELVIEQIKDEIFRQYMEVKSRYDKEIKDEEPRISYEQLSAILALSSVHWPPNSSNNDNDNDVGKVLCKALLRCIVRHAEKNDLDRESELQQFFQPVETYATKRENKAVLRHVLPMYVGYTASILTANPIPIMVGVSMTLRDKNVKNAARERKNVNSFAVESNRLANPEKASLLDEGEDMYESD